MVEITVQSSERTDFIDVTGMVQAGLAELDCSDGIVTVFCPHTTAALTINEGADPDVVRDMGTALDRMVPWDDGYHHAEGNSAAHIKASLYGSSVTLLVVGGELRLGTWQTVWFAEFDGPRQRRLWVAKS